jgi:retron-type reverse transcriptase
VLRCDVYRYFPAIDHDTLKADLRRRIACRRTLVLLDRIIDGSNPQEPVHLYYPGDALFTPFERRRGLPIGNLTSQLFANLYLDGCDHFCKEVLQAKGYVRYVDDFALFHDDPIVLQEWRQRIADYFVARRLSLHPRKTDIVRTCEPAEFLGFLLIRNGRRRLPEGNVCRFRRQLRGLRDRYRVGKISLDEVDRRVEAWIAHAEHADTWRLRHAIFQGRRFDPARKTDRPAVVGCSAAARGTTNRGTCVPRIATGTTRTTGTTTTGSAWPVRLQA